MTRWRSWKAAQRARWKQMSLAQRSGWLTGLVTLCATQIGVSASVRLSSFWAGFLTGFWALATLVSIIALVRLQRYHCR